MRGRVLIVAGSDSGGGAGIQADIKTVTTLDGFAMTAVTALTAQNTLGVHGIHAVPVEFIQAQMRVVLEDLGADVIKTGMLAAAPVIRGVAECLEQSAPAVPLVVDPVMVAKGGALLLESEAVKTLKWMLLPRAALITPNLYEAEVLTGLSIADEAGMLAAAKQLLELGPKAVLVKGGHLEGHLTVDLLLTAEGLTRFADLRIDTRHSHGTGCTLASAIACGIAQGLALPDAVARARAYVRRALETAPGFGRGNGPLNHAHTVRRDA
ncbi:bifunctional hydroxymethylpyrimidine kinase/phosphomethylpyrimidine kinase [Oleispirillum naphthae]|uniref:bifunctional hydroxymethylpyrimidine kinase/phosphomethylpyrimidine kinase n=1 Tax=Oleispirillum naphthae TaxID=2838853 RepID=UPI003082490F